MTVIEKDKIVEIYKLLNSVNDKKKEFASKAIQKYYSSIDQDTLEYLVVEMQEIFGHFKKGSKFRQFNFHDSLDKVFDIKSNDEEANYMSEIAEYAKEQFKLFLNEKEREDDKKIEKVLDELYTTYSELNQKTETNTRKALDMLDENFFKKRTNTIVEFTDPYTKKGRLCSIACARNSRPYIYINRLTMKSTFQTSESRLPNKLWIKMKREGVKHYTLVFLHEYAHVIQSVKNIKSDDLEVDADKFAAAFIVYALDKDQLEKKKYFSY